MAIHYVDGLYVDAAEAVLPLSDLAILRGYAVFDFLRTYGGTPFHLDEHLLRLRKSAALLHIPCPWPLEEIRHIVAELLRRNGFAESNIRFLVTGGDSDDSITPRGNARLIVMVSELRPFPQEWYSNGVKIVTSTTTRHVPAAKSTNYILAIMALQEARSRGAIESIYVNDNGELLEGTTSNLFVVHKDRIVTAGQDILPGITRQVVLRLAVPHYAVEHQAILRQTLSSCSEAFLTSSNKEVVPVVQIDDFRISDTPGPITRDLMRLFRDYTVSLKRPVAT